MNKFTLAAITGLIFLLLMPVCALAGRVSVTINQIDVPKGGMVKIGVYDVKGFPVIGQGVSEVALEVKEVSLQHVFTEIPAGQYAIAVFQDVNRDGELTKNLVGAPKEPYGFSRNVYGMFGPPDFEDVAFDVVADQPISLVINLD